MPPVTVQTRLHKGPYKGRASWITWIGPMSSGSCYSLHRVPQNPYIEILTQSTAEYNLIWKWSDYSYNQFRWGHTRVRWSPNPVGLVPSLKGGLDMSEQMQGEHYVKMKAELEWCFYKARNARDCQLTTRSQNESPGQPLHHSLRRSQPCWDPDLWLPAPRTVKQ